MIGCVAECHSTTLDLSEPLFTPCLVVLKPYPLPISPALWSLGRGVRATALAGGRFIFLSWHLLGKIEALRMSLALLEPKDAGQDTV